MRRRPSMPTPRAERRRDRPDELRGVPARLWFAMLGLALLPMGAALLLTAALIPEPDLGHASQRAWSTAAAAAGMADRQHRVEARLLATTTDVTLSRLLDGISGNADQQVASRTLASLRGPDGPIVLGACVSRPSGTPVAAFGDHPPGASACPSTSETTRALGLPAGSVGRSLLRGPDGRVRLILSAPLRLESRRPSGVLSAELALTELLTPPGDALAGPGDGETRPAASLLVDAVSHDVAVDGRAHVQALAEGVPSDLGVRIRGILAGHAGTARALAIQGWAATSAPLAANHQGPQLALIDVWPAVTPEPPLVLVTALAILLAAVVVIAVMLVRRFLRPFEILARSQARLEVLYAEAREDSLHDGLTGLGNHRAFQEELDRQMEIHRRHKVPVALLLVDLDDLKVVNDGEGHAAGDDLLQGMATNIRDALRYGDRAFRIGGDEFAVILPHTDAFSALVPASRLLHLCLRPPNGERRIPFSGGISAVPQLARDRDELYRQADAALYWCKRHGRASIEVFDADRDELVDHPAADAASDGVREVVRRRLLTPVFQPIVDLRTGGILGFEGLVRPAPEAPFADPGELFAAAAASGRTVELDLACLETVAAGARRIDASCVVSFNLSPRTLESHGFTASWILEVLSRNGIQPGRVIVEITEQEAISDLAALKRNAAMLQRAGVRVAADDVGAGNSGLRLLSQVRFDIVKIDLSLVRDGANDDSSLAVLRSLQELAAHQSAAVVAEGVETAEQLRVLRELGIPAAQGYLLGRPSTNVGLGAVDIGMLEAGTLIVGGPWSDDSVVRDGQGAPARATEMLGGSPA
jgi:diguanylate cyclase (GGDEF)-like protein